MTASDNLGNFYNALWHDTEGYVCIAHRRPDGIFIREYALWPIQREEVISHTLQISAHGYEAYITPAMWKDANATKAMFLGSHVLWADFDGTALETWPTDKGIPEPNIKVQSSTPDRQHTYWSLNTFITDAGEIENRNRTLALELGADSSGWDVGQLLRPPETTNFGYAKTERKGKTYPVTVDTLTNATFSLSEFKITKDFRPLVKEQLGAIPPVGEVIALKTWSPEFYKVFSEVPGDKARSDSMMTVAYYAAEAGFTNEEIYSLVADCNLRWGKYAPNRSDLEIRLIDIVERARTKYPLDNVELLYPQVIGQSVDPSLLKPYYNLDELQALDIQVNWLYKGLLPYAGYGIIAGPPGIGKTQVALRLAESYVSGTEFLVWKPVSTGTAFYLSLEMNGEELTIFLDQMTDLGRHARERFLIAPIGNSVELDRAEGLKYLESLLDQAQPGMLIIDSLSKAILADISKPDVAINFNKIINRLRVKYRTAVIVIHHNRKLQDKRQRSDELDDLFGGRFLAQDASFVLMMDRPHVRDGAGDITFNLVKSRFTRGMERFMANRSDDLNFAYERDIINVDDHFTPRGHSTGFNSPFNPSI